MIIQSDLITVASVYITTWLFPTCIHPLTHLGQDLGLVPRAPEFLEQRRVLDGFGVEGRVLPPNGPRGAWRRRADVWHGRRARPRVHRAGSGAVARMCVRLLMFPSAKRRVNVRSIVLIVKCDFKISFHIIISAKFTRTLNKKWHLRQCNTLKWHIFSVTLQRYDVWSSNTRLYTFTPFILIYYWKLHFINLSGSLNTSNSLQSHIFSRYSSPESPQCLIALRKTVKNTSFECLKKYPKLTNYNNWMHF